MSRKVSYSSGHKRRVNKKLLFFILAMFFSCSSVVLAMRVPNEINRLKEVKETLAEVNDTRTKDQNELVAANEEVSKLQDEVKELEANLKKVQTENPELYNALQNKEDIKHAYLTFDDGPSANTIKILDFLAANHIKATFFVIGTENNDAIYKRIVDEGHTLAIHSNTHDYSSIYVSQETFMNDITTLSDKLYGITGVRPKILRFPGGSNNTISKKYSEADLMDKLVKHVGEEGYIYYDWNVDSLDASANRQDKNVIVSSVLEGAKNKTSAIILMHDAAAKTTTVDALPEIVEGLRKEGFVFDKITEETEPVQFK